MISPRTGAVRLLIAALLVPAACGGTSNGVSVVSVGRTGSSAPVASVADSSVAAATTADTVPTTAAPVSTTDNSAKVEFTSPEGDFTVTFPGEPQSSATPVPLPDGSKLSMTTYTVERGDGAFIIAVADYPANLVNADTKAVLEGARDGALKNINATLTTSEAITLSGVPGIAFNGTIESSNGVATSHIFLDGVRLYQVIAVGDAASTRLTADTAAFLDSFKLTKVGG
jgi:hypothetical protein